MDQVTRTAAFYYSLLDEFCIILMLIFLFTTLIDADRNKYRLRLINLMVSLIAFCLVDIFWVLVYWDVLPRTQFLRTVSNVFLYCAINACSYSMFILLNGCLELVKPSKLFDKKLTMVPFWILIALAVTTPWTKLLFSIDEAGELIRGIFYIPFMVAIMGDLLLASVRAAILAFRPENEANRELCILVAFYGLPILIGGLLRAFFVSMPSVAFGTSVSVTLFFVMQIREQVSMDTLTGINNRRQGERFFIRQIQAINQRESESDGLYLFMADLDKFKSINDTYGHNEGDNALVVTAEALREACSQYADRCMLCRFGGDEFVLGGMFNSDTTADVFCTLLNDSVARKCKQNQLPYVISLSIGYARYTKEYKTFRGLLAVADKKMYERKRNKRKS